MTGTPLRVALGEYDVGWHDPATSLARARVVVDQAAAAGADLVVLPEMCTTGFTMESRTHAEQLSGRSVTTLAALARGSGVFLLAGVATRDHAHDGSSCYNSAILFGPRGGIVAEYRKQRLFAYAGEGDAYEAGSSALMVDIKGVRIAPFICFDLRFPELFRAVAPRIDAIVLIASWPAARRQHWDVLTHARAIENQCYVVAVNRVGNGGGVEYDGGSVVYGPWGEMLASERALGGGPIIVELDPAEVTRVRSEYPFVEDRRSSAV